MDTHKPFKTGAKTLSSLGHPDYIFKRNIFIRNIPMENVNTIAGQLADLSELGAEVIALIPWTDPKLGRAKLQIIAKRKAA